MRHASILVFLVACHHGGAPAVPDTTGAGGDAPADGGVPFDPGAEPTVAIEPVFGELTIRQLDLRAGLTLKIGESTIVVGPDGTIVLIDVGNTSHADDIRAAILHLNTDVLTPAHGYPARAPLQVEWIIITHFHADHVGGLPALLGGSNGIQVMYGILHRGYVDVGQAMNPDSYQAACTLLHDPAFAPLDSPLCHAATEAPCDPSQWTGNYPATDCYGLLAPDAFAPSGTGAMAISLGNGALLELVGADGYASSGSGLDVAAPFGHEMNGQENARSIVGFIEYGAFRYHFAGDLTGAGDVESPDLESHLVATASTFYGDRGFDVAHANHHARKTSSNAAFVAAVSPHDGRARNVIGGINAAYLGSPAPEVLASWGNGGRLGDGDFWVTEEAAGGGTSTELVDAEGPVNVQTIQRGVGYRVQAAGAALHSHAFLSVGAQ